jgi:hypothetical protein
MFSAAQMNARRKYMQRNQTENLKRKKTGQGGIGADNVAGTETSP